MAESTRYSVLAIKKESTEGTPVAPASGADFIALQDGFSFEPAFDVKESAELRGSIGVAKSILGKEAPKANFPHYVRHSGVEGQAPGYSPMLEACFGQVTAVGSEDVVAAGTTVSAVTVGTGLGAGYARGRCILAKDGSNGYQIRPVFSVASDVLTLGFNLNAVPANGVKLGKPVYYSPLSSGHPTLTLWEYRANGGALEMISGCRVTDFTMNVKSGDLISGAYTFEGVQYYFDPINILAADTKLDFLDNATTRVATITAQVYKDPYTLAQAIQDAMNSLGSANTFAVTYNSTGASAGKFTVTSTGSTLTLKWNTGANAANTVGDKIGFNTAADSTGALTYTSANAQSWAAGFTPSYDVANPLAAKDCELLLGDSTDISSFISSELTFKITNSRQEIDNVCSPSGVSGSVITKRQVSVDLTALLTRNDADKFKRYRANADAAFLYNFGEKSGGNWIPGKSCSLYIPVSTISSFKMDDLNGLVVLKMSLRPYIDANGNGEVYLNFL